MRILVQKLVDFERVNEDEDEEIINEELGEVAATDDGINLRQRDRII